MLCTRSGTTAPPRAARETSVCPARCCCRVSQARRRGFLPAVTGSARTCANLAGMQCRQKSSRAAGQGCRAGRAERPFTGSMAGTSSRPRLRPGSPCSTTVTAFPVWPPFSTPAFPELQSGEGVIRWLWLHRVKPEAWPLSPCGPGRETLPLISVFLVPRAHVRAAGHPRCGNSDATTSLAWSVLLCGLG